MKIVQIIYDDREAHKDYGREMPWFGTAPTALLQGFSELGSAVEIHIVSCAQRGMKSPAKLDDNIFFHSLVVPKIGWLRTGYQGCIRAIRRKLREIGPDIVHGQGSERYQNLSAALSGYPNVLTIHGNMRLVAQLERARPFSFLWLAARIEAFTIPRSDGVVCITNYTREAAASLARKTWLLPNAVDRTFFEVQRVPSPAVRILCVATVGIRKNQNALIRAMDTIPRPAGFELVFLGGANRNDPYVREFFELVEARSWCRYAGFSDRKGLRDYMASAAGLVLPSLEDNCPMVVLEAMASGVAVAAARVGGVPDLVRQGETGWMFDPLDQNSIAEAMKRLLENRDPAMTARAQAEARERFHPRIIAQRHVEIYREVLASRRG